MKKRKPVLSIGLIVKNEAENLERCLESLQPLRDALPCQLVITDTGSADNTREIALRYTDEVYDFAWCDDFAAARNAGLDKAQGEWFMFIDADEYLDDTSELIRFFTSGTYRQYQNANYYVRNYRWLNQQDLYQDTAAFRLFNRLSNRRFQDKIHEFVPFYMDKNYSLNQTIAHHYGYAENHSEAYQQQKEERNITLLEQMLAEQPENLRVLKHCAETYAKWGYTEKYHETVHKGYRIVEKTRVDEIYPTFVRMEVQILWSEGKADEAITAAESYLQGKKQPYTMDIDITYLLGIYYHDLEQYALSLQWLDRYDELWQLPLDKAFVKKFTLFNSLKYHTEVPLQFSRALRSRCCLALNDIERAEGYFDQIKLGQMIGETWKYYYMEPALQLAAKTKQLERIPAAYQEILAVGTIQEGDQFVQLLEQFIEDGHLALLEVAKAFCQAFPWDNGLAAYLQLQWLRLLLEPNIEPQEQSLAAMAYFQQLNQQLPAAYSEVLLICCLTETPFTALVQNIPQEQYMDYVDGMMAQLKGDVMERFIQVMQRQQAKQHSVQEAYFFSCLLEKLILCNVQPQQPVSSIILQLYGVYLQLGWQYVSQYYQAERLADHGFLLLPQACRFLCYQHEAEIAQVQGQETAYKRNLNQAAASYPIMRQLVIAQLEQRKQQQAAQDEFAQAAIQVKENILGLLHMGQLAEAKELLQLYMEINPKDTDGITLLRNKVIAATADTTGL